MRGTVPSLGGQAGARERRRRCLTFRKLGETSLSQKHPEGKLVSLLDLLWGLSLQGGGERHWQWPPADQHHLAFWWPALQLRKPTA